MANWSYSGNPASSALDETRFRMGDTNVADQLLSNDEVTFLLTQNANDPLAAAISGVRSLIAAAARTEPGTKKVGDLSISRDGAGRISQWESLLAQLEAESGARVGPGVMADAVTQFALGAMDNSA